jgi:hypothetical protein
VADPAKSLEETAAANADIQPWELHSELVLVSPELRRRSLELLPERDPDAFPARPRQPPMVPAPAPADDEPALRPIDVLRYALHRVAQSARLGLIIVATIVVLAMLAELIAR